LTDPERWSEFATNGVHADFESTERLGTQSTKASIQCNDPVCPEIRARDSRRLVCGRERVL
jgi:hypothetical protein